MPDTVDLDVEPASRSPVLGAGGHQEIDLKCSWEIEDIDALDEEWIGSWYLSLGRSIDHRRPEHVAGFGHRRE